MSWYAATSKDLVNWTPCKQQPALKPNQHYDREGIFTGYALPRGIHGEKGQMTALYTSVSICSPNTVSDAGTDLLSLRSQAQLFTGHCPTNTEVKALA